MATLENLFVGQTVVGDVVFTSLYGVDDAGQRHLVFDPNVNRIQDTGYGDIMAGTFVVSGDDLYFQVGYASGLNETFVSTQYLMRLDGGGNLTLVTQMPDRFVAAGPILSSDPGSSIVATRDGFVTVLVEDFQNRDRPPADVWNFSPDTGFSLAADFFRQGYSGATGSLVHAGTTLFMVADQQSPQISYELWRLKADGALEVVWFASDQSVLDVEAFNGSAWFLTGSTVTGSPDGLWRVTDGGVAQQLGLPQTANPVFLDTDGGGLHLVYEVAGGGGSQIARVNRDGSLTDLLTTGQYTSIIDVIRFDGAVHFVGIGPGSSTLQLFRIGARGAVEALPNEVGGEEFAFLSLTGFGLSTGGDALFFTGNFRVDDGFGGLISRLGYVRLTADGTLSLVSGGVADDMDPAPVAFVESIAFGTAPALLGAPVLGNASNEVLSGTRLSEEVLALGGADTVNGFAGDDTIRGGAGSDRLVGGTGADLLDGGHGNDQMAGGLGNDTYMVDQINDRVTGEGSFATGGGLDRVWTVVDYAAPLNVEFLGALVGAGDIALAGNSGANTLDGNEGANRLDGRGGDDRLNGNAGQDTLIGGLGRDILDGGDGADTFVFLNLSSSPTDVFARDTILGFARTVGARDVIDLSAIDANQTTAALNDAFTYIGAAEFTAAGQLRIQRSVDALSVIVEGDVNGDRDADFSFFVDGQTAMQRADFVL